MAIFPDYGSPAALPGSRAEGRTGVTLDAPPPSPPSLLELTQQQAAGSAGRPGGGPHLMAMEGFGLIRKGAQLLQAAIPQLAPALQELVSSLQTSLPRAMAERERGGTAAGIRGGPVVSAPPEIGGQM